jgi:predicted SAM-dependent methyltransferase
VGRKVVAAAKNGNYVHYGSGLCAPPSWKNFDASPTLRLQRLPLIGRAFSSSPFRRKGIVVFPANVVYGDIVRGLPLSAGSCQAIYCSHVLEHLTLDDFRVALRNTYTYLRPGGTFRFVLPDLQQMARHYLNSAQQDAAHLFMESSCLGKKSRARGLERLLRSWLGSGSHLWMWDYKAIKAELEQVGFRKIRRAEFGDSREVRFKEVEEKERWEKCLGVEAEK